MSTTNNNTVPVFHIPVESPKDKLDKPGKRPDPSVPENDPPKIKEPPGEKAPAVREPEPDEIKRKAYRGSKVN